MHLIASVFKIIPNDWHGRFYMLVSLYVVLSIFEMLGVASIMPFVALLSDATALSNSSIGKLFLRVSLVPIDQLPVHVVGLVVVFLFVFGSILSLASLWLSIRFSAALSVRLAGDVSSRFFERGLRFLQSESPAVLANYTIREVDRAASGGVLQLCMIISKLFQVSLIAVLLSFVSPMFSLVFGFSALILYGLFFRVLRRRMAGAGNELLEAGGQATRTANELYMSAREVAVRGNSAYFISVIRSWLRKGHDADEVARVFPMMPKYLIELIAFTLLLSLPIYRSWTGQEYRSLVPFIALFAYAGYRLLPGIQQIYSSLSILKFNASAVEYLGGYLRDDILGVGTPLRVTEFSRSIQLVNVSCVYPGANGVALSDISLSIAKGEKIAIVGLSGSGKSTLLDILLGLVPPTTGKVLIDGVDCSGKRLDWSPRLIGYAPQAPLILGASVAENIAFGVAPIDIDQNRCQEVADFALVSDAVANLPRGLATLLGGDGVALSGGESQRISIARALYHSPEIVVLDEPTSSLDPILSERLFERLCAKDFGKTVIAVTHDWEALPAFDKVVLVDAGNLIGVGNYAEVARLVEDLRMREAKEG